MTTETVKAPGGAEHRVTTYADGSVYAQPCKGGKGVDVMPGTTLHERHYRCQECGHEFTVQVQP